VCAHRGVGSVRMDFSVHIYSILLLFFLLLQLVRESLLSSSYLQLLIWLGVLIFFVCPFPCSPPLSCSFLSITSTVSTHFTPDEDADPTNTHNTIGDRDLLSSSRRKKKEIKKRRTAAAPLHLGSTRINRAHTHSTASRILNHIFCLYYIPKHHNRNIIIRLEMSMWCSSQRFSVMLLLLM
jgi:hypothetical protein